VGHELGELTLHTLFVGVEWNFYQWVNVSSNLFSKACLLEVIGPGGKELSRFLLAAV
jgi:hypothetical protein